MASSQANDGVVGIGVKALHTIRQTLIEDLGEAGEARLQEIGYAAGEEVFQHFCHWLPEFAGVADPGDLDSTRFSEVLSAFFQSLGWGPAISPRGCSRASSRAWPGGARSRRWSWSAARREMFAAAFWRDHPRRSTPSIRL